MLNSNDCSIAPLEVLSMFMAVIACLSLFCDGWLLFCLFSKGARCVCVVPALLSLIVSVHGGHSLPVVWMCVFHGGHSLSGVRMCVVLLFMAVIACLLCGCV